MTELKHSLLQGGTESTTPNHHETLSKPLVTIESIDVLLLEYKKKQFYLQIIFVSLCYPITAISFINQFSLCRISTKKFSSIHATIR